MNDHFSSMLAPAQATAKSVPFIKASSFEGKKEGYKFQKGPSGIGYYIDPKQRADEVKISIRFAPTCQQLPEKKRPLEDDDGDAPAIKVSKPNPVSIEQLLEQADTADITILNPNSLQQVIFATPCCI